MSTIRKELVQGAAPPSPGRARLLSRKADAVDAGPSARSHGSRFRADIEGLRGIAVLLVVWYHTQLAGLPGGFIGVDVFFVISGYLITGLLVSEVRRTGRIDLGAFYARRIRRLLPAALLTIAATLTAGLLLLSPRDLARFSVSAGAAAFYTSNLRFILSSGNYFTAALETDPFLHTWSLAVEEQFYLVWPLLIMLSLRGGRAMKWLLVVMAGVSALSFLASLWLTWHSPGWAFFGSPNRAWEFGVGAVGALLPVGALGRSVRWRAAVGWLGLAAVVAAGAWLSGQARFPGYVALLPVLGSVLVLMAGGGSPTGGVGRLLGTWPLQRLGELSYSWYLWHWPVLVLAQALVPGMGLVGRVVCSVASLALSATTHSLIENPVRFHPRLAAKPALGLALGVLLTVTGGAVAVLARSIAGREAARPEYRALDAVATHEEEIECLESDGAGKLVACGALQRDGRPTVVLLGDSHAWQWRPALRLLAQDNGWRLVVLTKGACPAAAVPGMASASWDPDFRTHCNAWRALALQRIGRLRPELVVLSQSRESVVGARRKEPRLRATPEEWRQGNHELLQALSGISGSTLLIRDTPRLGFDVPVCLAEALRQSGWHQLRCDSERSAALDEPVFAAEKAAAAGVPRVAIVDPTDAFCGPQRCLARVDGIVAYSDTDHMTAVFAQHLLPLLRDWIGRTPSAGRLPGALAGGAGAGAESHAGA